jgi:hypothetical protein
MVERATQHHLGFISDEVITYDVAHYYFMPKIGCLLSFHMLFRCRGFRDLILWVMIVITFDFMCLLGDVAIMIYSGCPKEARCASRF